MLFLYNYNILDQNDFFLVNSKSHGLIHFINVVNVRNVCNLKSITKKVYIKLIYMVNIISMIKRRKYISCANYYTGSDLLYVYVTEEVCVTPNDKILLVLSNHILWKFY